MDIQHETIIPRHYCVAGYKKGYNSHNNWFYPKSNDLYLMIIYLCVKYESKTPIFLKKNIERKTFFEEEIGP